MDRLYLKIGFSQCYIQRTLLGLRGRKAIVGQGLIRLRSLEWIMLARAIHDVTNLVTQEMNV